MTSPAAFVHLLVPFEPHVRAGILRAAIAHYSGRAIAVSITVEATYENGVLKPDQPLPLQEHAKVRITVEPRSNGVQETAGIIPCTDAQLIEWAASDAELDYPPPPETP
jgi:predicted DNA-binding antitoxin AbrB/MazE fold protein